MLAFDNKMSNVVRWMHREHAVREQRNDRVRRVRRHMKIDKHLHVFGSSCRAHTGGSLGRLWAHIRRFQNPNAPPGLSSAPPSMEPDRRPMADTFALVSGQVCRCGGSLAGRSWCP